MVFLVADKDSDVINVSMEGDLLNVHAELLTLFDVAISDIAEKYGLSAGKLMGQSVQMLLANAVDEVNENKKENKRMNATVFKNVIEDIIRRARERVPSITDDMLDDDGAIYYMNGNDTTWFDWAENHRLCEFFVFHKTGRGFIKVNIYDDNVANVYIYEDGGMSPTDKYKEQLEGVEMERFERCMEIIADDEGLYDVVIDELDWDVEV